MTGFRRRRRDSLSPSQVRVMDLLAHGPRTILEVADIVWGELGEPRHRARVAVNCLLALKRRGLVTEQTVSGVRIWALSTS
jgi:hypothetical protein